MKIALKRNVFVCDCSCQLRKLAVRCGAQHSAKPQLNTIKLNIVKWTVIWFHVVTFLSVSPSLYCIRSSFAKLDFLIRLNQDLVYGLLSTLHTLSHTHMYSFAHRASLLKLLFMHYIRVLFVGLFIYFLFCYWNLSLFKWNIIWFYRELWNVYIFFQSYLHLLCVIYLAVYVMP